MARARSFALNILRKNRAMGPLRPTVYSNKKKQAEAPQKGDALTSTLEGHAFGSRN